MYMHLADVFSKALKVTMKVKIDNSIFLWNVTVFICAQHYFVKFMFLVILNENFLIMVLFLNMHTIAHIHMLNML